MVQGQRHIVGLRIRFPCLLWGPFRAEYARQVGEMQNSLVAGSGYSTWSITRGTPPRLEGCRPASRGLTLALMTTEKRIARDDVAATGLIMKRFCVGSPVWAWGKCPYLRPA